MKTTEERFWEKVDKTPGFGPNKDCWKWTGSLFIGGHGRFWNGKKTVPAGRYAHDLINPPMAPGLLACHTCDNPACVRPTHIFAGTNKDNTADMIAKGRQHNQKKTHCNRGHEYTVENTRITIHGGRMCRTCDRLHARNRFRAANPDAKRHLTKYMKQEAQTT